MSEDRPETNVGIVPDILLPEKVLFTKWLLASNYHIRLKDSHADYALGSRRRRLTNGPRQARQWRVIHCKERAIPRNSNWGGAGCRRRKERTSWTTRWTGVANTSLETKLNSWPKLHNNHKSKLRRRKGIASSWDLPHNLREEKKGKLNKVKIFKLNR